MIQNVRAMRVAASTTKILASMPWKIQKRPAG